MDVILASASPRRKELLEKIGLTFDILPAAGEERSGAITPWETVAELSVQKACEVAHRLGKPGGAASRRLIIGADTVVAYDGQILGKPKDREDAFRMLSMLQGGSHMVYTGVTFAVWERDVLKTHSFYEQTKVVMYPMEESEILWYIGTGEPFDKAGAYGIQGKCAIFIKEIHGDYDNVVGLPSARLYQELKKLGIAVFAGVEGHKAER